MPHEIVNGPAGFNLRASLVEENEAPTIVDSFNQLQSTLHTASASPASVLAGHCATVILTCPDSTIALIVRALPSLNAREKVSRLLLADTILAPVKREKREVCSFVSVIWKFAWRNVAAKIVSY